MRTFIFSTVTLLVLGALISLAMFGAFVLELASNTPKDNTDPPHGRSGMDLHTDSLTGCQYLSRGHSLTPRLGADGKQVCTPTKATP